MPVCCHEPRILSLTTHEEMNYVLIYELEIKFFLILPVSSLQPSAHLHYSLTEPLD